MDVAVALLLVVAAIFVPALCAVIIELPHARRYALALVGLAGVAVLPLTLRPHALAWSGAYAVASTTSTVALLSSTRPKLAPLAAALGVTLTIVTAALAWVSTLGA